MEYGWGADLDEFRAEVRAFCKKYATDDLRAFLAVSPQEEFYVAPFIDYRGAEGLYAKARVVLIDGIPLASHLASSVHWMVHYLNTQMETSASRRTIEADWMASFDDGFAQRQGKALKAVAKAIGLDGVTQ